MDRSACLASAGIASRRKRKKGPMPGVAELPLEMLWKLCRPFPRVRRSRATPARVGVLVTRKASENSRSLADPRHIGTGLTEATLDERAVEHRSKLSSDCKRIRSPLLDASVIPGRMRTLETGRSVSSAVSRRRSALGAAVRRSGRSVRHAQRPCASKPSSRG
ncbi:hypothetical protein BV20DRAFT_826237 [Pilatotrama ljubarskyi]|nr:hypothetical protein BV20DRAFT_826237 [Pilatotrama ljubarskyi]